MVVVYWCLWDSKSFTLKSTKSCTCVSITNNEDKGASRGKSQHITVITWRMPLANILSKGVMNMNIAKLIVVYKKDRNVTSKTLSRPMLGFRDSEKVRGP